MEHYMLSTLWSSSPGTASPGGLTTPQWGGDCCCHDFSGEEFKGREAEDFWLEEVESCIKRKSPGAWMSGAQLNSTPFFFLINLFYFIYFIFGCIGSSLLHVGFL